ncbi:MAG: UDP-N-acetylglucosamine 2-epimerase (non-hydrolyzing) [Sedimentisphaerales bacterium]|nr:UDP-N-acetylglucosamine 2-epimerase (non-hydrolyzing) [Sedimentisphaerales bacterium]
MKILNVVGARPNFMKIAPLIAEYNQHETISSIIVHTGQHYDEIMSNLFFHELCIPEPDINLEVGSASHAVQTAEIMKRFEPVLLGNKPDVVVVVGDVNSTIACGLVAVKLGVRLVHVEAGLRSGDRTMPEEINRVLTDSISDLLFCTEQSGVDNLIKEGIAKEKIHLVGHVMIDTLLNNLEKAKKSTIIKQLQKKGYIEGNDFVLLTMHRPSNVDNPKVFSQILDALEIIQKDVPILFPIHPRTRKNLTVLNLKDRLDSLRNIHLMEPIGYLDFLKLNSCAKVVLTDSGGIQEETTVLKVPCITLRENTERPVTAQIGSNQIAGSDPEKILAAYRNATSGKWREPQIPPLWDGKAAQRIVKILLEQL